MSQYDICITGAAELRVDEVADAAGLYLNYVGAGGVTYKGTNLTLSAVEKIVVEDAKRVSVPANMYPEWSELDESTAAAVRVSLITRKILKNVYHVYFDSIRTKLSVIETRWERELPNTIYFDIGKIRGNQKEYADVVKRKLEVHPWFVDEQKIKKIFQQVAEPTLDDLTLGQRKIGNDVARINSKADKILALLEKPGKD